MFNNTSILQRRTFHCSRKVCEEWTKAGLRRMKKTDLVHLAKQNHIDTSGTKNDIVIHLLNHQTAKIVGSTTSSLHSIRKVVEKSDDVPEDAVSTVDADMEWTKAFEMKTAQRGSRKPLSNSRDHFTSSSSKPHPFNDAMKSTIVKPAVEQLKSTTPSSATVILPTEKPTMVTKKETHKQQATELSDELLDGMDPAWVEAFDMKVGSRGARHHLTDTLSPCTPTLSASLVELPSMKADKPENPSTTDGLKKDVDTSNDAWISALVGTSMLAWYIGGEQGLANIWHFFSS